MVHGFDHEEFSEHFRLRKAVRGGATTEIMEMAEIEAEATY